MIKTSGMISSASYYDKMSHQKNSSKIKKNDAVLKENIKSSEDKLSAKAKDYLEKLRKEYGDYDFMVAGVGDDKRALLDSSDKEFSVMFSTAEIEKMANDEEYANEKMRKVQTIVDMSDRICEQFGLESAWDEKGEKGVSLNKLAVSINDDGTMSIFAELEKMNEKQMEHIEKMKEKHLDEKKEAKKADKNLDEKKIDNRDEKKVNEYKKDDFYGKKVVVEAVSEEDLVEKITNIDWNKAKAVNVGAKLDLTV